MNFYKIKMENKARYFGMLILACAMLLNGCASSAKKRVVKPKLPLPDPTTTVYQPETQDKKPAPAPPPSPAAAQPETQDKQPASEPPPSPAAAQPETQDKQPASTPPPSPAAAQPETQDLQSDLPPQVQAAHDAAISAGAEDWYPDVLEALKLLRNEWHDVVLRYQALVDALRARKANSALLSNTQGAPVSRLIAAAGIKTEAQLAEFFLAHNPREAPSRVKRIASYYIFEAQREGINSDAAFVQMCHETDFLRFGRLVTADMNNFCGLGAIDAAHRGERFESEQLGIRAHIQHLQAYAVTVPLIGILVDPRYKLVQPRGKSPDIFALAGTWSVDKAYGKKLDSLLEKLGKY